MLEEEGMMKPVMVISQQPPGGRCTLYARYAVAISDLTGWAHSVVHTETRDAHGEGFPSLCVRDVPLQPEDAFILAPEEIVAHLAGLGVERPVLDTLAGRLQEIYDEFVGSAAR